MIQTIGLRGEFRFELFKFKDIRDKWMTRERDFNFDDNRKLFLPVSDIEISNGITNEGKNKLLDVMFHGTSAITTWYLGLIDNAGFSALDAADVMNSHTGWDEFTAYDETTRPAWTEGAASGQSITNGTPVTFTINGSGTLKGGFVTSENTISGTTGTLWATAAFSGGTQPVSASNLLKITYTVNA